MPGVFLFAMNSAPRALALSLALVAMLLRGFLPAGWMPAADGSATIVICTGHGVVRSTPQHRGHTLPDRRDQLCPFAAAAHHAPPVRFAALAAPAESSPRIVLSAFDERVPARRPFAGHSPRAPPHFA